MSDSDDEFSLGFSGGGGGGGVKYKGTEKGKGKGKAAKRPVKNKKNAVISGLDDLLAESERGAGVAVMTSALVDTDNLISLDLHTKANKARTKAADAQDKADHLAIMADESIATPGAILVFRPPQREPAVELPFDVRCPRKELKDLFEALERAASATDTADLEEMLGMVLVPWVRENLGGKTPPEVCRWLLRVVATHGLPPVALAAEQALLDILAESGNAWKLRYEDVLVIWRKCGAMWLAEHDDDGRGGGGGGGAQGPDGEARDEVEEDGDGDAACLPMNMRPALNVVEACLRTGAHDMSNDELRELTLDLAAASLDEGVTGLCQSEVNLALEALVDAMPVGYYEDPEAFSSLVDGLCDPSARALQSRMTPPSFVVLARNLPCERSSSAAGGSSSSSSNSSSDSGGGKEVRSLRYQVCHRLLKQRFLVGTSYAGEDDPSVGFGRAIKALQVLLNNEDNLLEDDSQEGYERQYAIVALVSELVASVVVVSRGETPGSEQAKELIGLLDGIDKKLRDVMQDCVQNSKNVLDLMKSKYSSRIVSSSRQQIALSFAQTSGGGGGGGGGRGGSSTANGGGGGREGCEDRMGTDEFDDSQQ